MHPVTRQEILALALPSMAAAVLNNGYRVLGQYAVQDLGVAAQAAVGSSVYVLITLYALFALIHAGVGPLVARATGMGDLDLRRRVIGAALLGALGLALAAGGALYVGAPWVASALGLSGETAACTVTYLRGVALVAPALALEPVIDGALIAMGRGKTALLLQGVAVGLNAALNPSLIAAFGVGGAAAATGVGRAVAVAGGLYALRALTSVGPSDLRLDPSLQRVARVGLPITLNTLAYAIVYWALLRVAVSPLGPATNAALGVGFSALEGLSWPMFLGLSVGLASVVGRRLGAGQPEEAARALRLSAPYCTAAGVASGLAFYFLARPLCALFTHDPEVLEAAIVYAQVLAFSQVFVAWEAMFEGVLEGAGDTRTLLLWSAPLNVLRVPLGYALAFPLGWGAAGVWWAINLTTWLKVLGKGLAVRRGRWRDVAI